MMKQEQLIAKLTLALGMVKTSSSLVPICCHCRKIRDADDCWQCMDEYIDRHFSNVAFTHGICPDCAKSFSQQYFAGHNQNLTSSKSSETVMDQHLITR